jgi:hypothetical protein
MERKIRLIRGGAFILASKRGKINQLFDHLEIRSSYTPLFPNVRYDEAIGFHIA